MERQAGPRQPCKPSRGSSSQGSQEWGGVERSRAEQRSAGALGTRTPTGCRRWESRRCRRLEKRARGGRTHAGACPLGRRRPSAQRLVRAERWPGEQYPLAWVTQKWTVPRKWEELQAMRVWNAGGAGWTVAGSLCQVFELPLFTGLAQFCLPLINCDIAR